MNTHKAIFEYALSKGRIIRLRYNISENIVEWIVKSASTFL